VNSTPANAAAILAQIRRYSAAQVAASCRLLRQVAGLDAYVDRFFALYERTIDTHKQALPDLREEQRAVARYLRSLAPFTKALDYLPADGMNPPGYGALREQISRQLDQIPATDS
jgi:hypothetical protein